MIYYVYELKIEKNLGVKIIKRGTTVTEKKINTNNYATYL